MSAGDIIKELPRFTEADRRHIREELLEITNADPNVVLCNQSARDNAELLDRMEDNKSRHSSN